MSYDWEHEAEKSGTAPRLPAGLHEVEIIRLVFENKNGYPFKSKAGDWQILVVVADDQGRECSDMITLTHKAAWRLARMLSVGGRDVRRMKADGIEPEHFADVDFAKRNLMGLRFPVRCIWGWSDNGKDTQDIDVLTWDDYRQRTGGGAQRPQARPSGPSGRGNDIPF